MTTPSIPRARIRQWWAEQLATGQPIDLDAAAAQATEQLLADPEFVLTLAEIVQPMVREIGQQVTTKRTPVQRDRRIQVGSTVMSREQAMALVDNELSGRPHWSKLVRCDGAPQWFMTLGRDDLMREANRRREAGETRLREATFLLAVANNLRDGQIVADVWRERELDLLFDGIEVEVTASDRNVTFAFEFDKQKALGAA